MIYLVYPLLITALLWGSRLSKKGEWNEGAFSLEQMKAVQGFTAICIMLHHIGQHTCASWLDPALITPGLEIFVPFGFYMVGIFMFCSGYGLFVSYKTKPGYLGGSFILPDSFYRICLDAYLLCRKASSWRGHATPKGTLVSGAFKAL